MPSEPSHRSESPGGTPRRHRPVLGVDGTRTGWVGVRWDGVTVTPTHDTTLGGLVDRAGDIAIVAVDMPIGLERRDRRACDDEVRPLLGARRASLFAAPALGALDHATYAEANAWSKAATGRGLSKQAWMLVPKILEVRAFVAASELPAHETFPELSFVAMAGEPLRHPKRTWNGMASRVELLRAAGLHLPSDAGPAGDVAADDLIDAAALAWSAARILLGTAECRPAPPSGSHPPHPTGTIRRPEPDDRPTIWW